MNEAVVKKGVSGSTLKIIAITAMLIDHIGAVILERILANNGIYQLDTSNMEASMAFVQNNSSILTLNLAFRTIGRIGFPIFCFLLIEGFLHTKNVWKYAFRLFLFCLLSEIPFDLAFRSSFFDMSYQNVFFTLLIGLLALIFIQMSETKFYENVWLRYLLIIPISLIFMMAANLLRTDYGGMGVITIIVMYLLRKNKVMEMAGGCIVLTIMSFMEIVSLLTLIPVHKYNGERGLNLKYIFYAFYPVHLLILYLITYFMGMADALKLLY